MFIDNEQNRACTIEHIQHICLPVCHNPDQEDNIYDQVFLSLCWNYHKINILGAVFHCAYAFKITDVILPKLTVDINWIQICDQVLKNFIAHI